MTDGDVINIRTTDSFLNESLDLLEEKPRDDDETYGIVDNAFDMHAPLITSF